MIENIYFKIGQPNTGKSYSFRKENLEKEYFNDKEIEYLKIPVSGGIGNEYKGLQNTDLAISYDPIKENLKFGEFLQMLMKAILNPNINYIVFLDDFHNQDISSLLSEYTPLFKAGQKVDLKNKIKLNEELKEELKEELLNKEDFNIEKWNEFIDSLKVIQESITNRVSGESLKLVFPSNFYLLGCANFNEKTINIFADWSDRAKIEYVNPIKIMEELKDENDFIKCTKKLNKDLQEILENKNIYDYEKYCFGIWKVKDITELEEQKEIIKFFFFMIKNSLIYNNKNSEINEIG